MPRSVGTGDSVDSVGRLGILVLGDISCRQLEISSLTPSELVRELLIIEFEPQLRCTVLIAQTKLKAGRLAGS